MACLQNYLTKNNCCLQLFTKFTPTQNRYPISLDKIYKYSNLKTTCHIKPNVELKKEKQYRYKLLSVQAPAPRDRTVCKISCIYLIRSKDPQRSHLLQHCG